MSFSNYEFTSSYSNYEPTPPTEEEITEENRLFNIRKDYIKKYAEENNLILLKSDYWGMDHYYYSKEYKRMYKVSIHFSFSDKSLEPKFELWNDNHIMEINYCSAF